MRTKKERREMYHYILLQLIKRSYAAPFVCHIISFKKTGKLSNYNVRRMKEEFNELAIFTNNEEDGFFSHDCDPHELRELIVLFCIEMTR